MYLTCKIAEPEVCVCALFFPTVFHLSFWWPCRTAGPLGRNKFVSQLNLKIQLSGRSFRPWSSNPAPPNQNQENNGCPEELYRLGKEPVCWIWFSQNVLVRLWVPPCEQIGRGTSRKSILNVSAALCLFNRDGGHNVGSFLAVRPPTGNFPVTLDPHWKI